MPDIPPDEAKALALAWLQTDTALRHIKARLAAPPPLYEDPDDIRQDATVRILVRFTPESKPAHPDGFPAGYCRKVINRIVADRRRGAASLGWRDDRPIDELPDIPADEPDVPDQVALTQFRERLPGRVHHYRRYAERGEQIAIALHFASHRWFGELKDIPLHYPERRESGADWSWWQAVAATFLQLQDPIIPDDGAAREKARRRDVKRRWRDRAALPLRLACEELGFDPPAGDID